MRPKKIKKKIHAAEVVTEKAALAKKATDDKPVITVEVKVPTKAVEEKTSAPKKETKSAPTKKPIDTKPEAPKPVITEEVKPEAPAKVVEEKKSAPSKATGKKSAPSKKAPAKKETKNTPSKKSTDGKTEAPSKKFTEPTFNIEFQYAGKAIPYDEIVKRAKEATGGKDNINIYVKPEENRVYYVAESDVGSFEI